MKSTNFTLSKITLYQKDYDIIKYRGKVRIKEETYKKRKDLVSIKKLRDYTREEVINFLIANFVSGERWGGLFDVDAADTKSGLKGKIKRV